MKTPESLPKFLSLRDVEAWLAGFGVSVERDDLCHALRQMPIEGCIPPSRPGQRWTIPKKALLNVLVACLARRCDRSDVWPVRFDRVFFDAAEMLMLDPEIAPTMSPALKKDVRERRKARRGRLGVYP